MCLHAHGYQRKTLDLLELELQMVVSHPMGALEIELGLFSDKTANAFNC